MATIDSYKIKIKAGNISRKAVKRLYNNPKESKCPECASELREVTTWDLTVKKHKLLCKNVSCTFWISLEKGEVETSYTGNNKPTSRSLAPFNRANWGFKPEVLVLNINKYRISDQFYDISIDERKIGYNPVTRLIKIGHAISTSNDDEHSLYLECINKSLQEDAQNQDN